jgi:hypothetical protein
MKARESVRSRWGRMMASAGTPDEDEGSNRRIVYTMLVETVISMLFMHNVYV